MKKVSIFAILTVVSFLAASCAKSAQEDEYYSYDRVLQAWINVNHPGVQPNDSGVFILHYEQGAGDTIPDSGYVFAHYWRKSLKGDYASTNIDSISDRLTSKGVTYYSGSDIWRVDQGCLPNGIAPIIKGMQVGGKVELALPVGMSEVYSSAYGAFNSSETDNVLYYFEIDKAVENIYDYQDSILKAYSEKYYGGMDTLSEGFYFKLIGRREGADTVSDETVHPLRYWGKRIEDGVMFDTNVKDTAKKYGLYSSSNSYDTLGVARYFDLSTMISNASTINGFTRAVHEMRLGDTVEVFFRSDLGYGYSGSGTSIPEYAPLFFHIYTDPDLGSDDDDDDD